MLPRTVNIALVGDYQPLALAHRAIPEALRLAGCALEVHVQQTWHPTRELAGRIEKALGSASGIWCVPAGPYAHTGAALSAIRFARESSKPFLGTCAGFQHALLEYTQHVLGRTRAAHAELDPEAEDTLIAPLACSLVEQAGTVAFESDSIPARAYGATQTVEGYHCRYGLSREHEHLFHAGALRIVGRDPQGEVRAVELTDHPFFVATLFQPERVALKGQTPPLVRAFVEAASASLET